MYQIAIVICDLFYFFICNNSSKEAPAQKVLSPSLRSMMAFMADEFPASFMASANFTKRPEGSELLLG